MKQDEKSLVEALHRGDQYACDELVKRYTTQVYNIALRLTGHTTEAEEILQETFINACQGVDNFEGRSSLSTWLYRIAKNHGLMRLRRKEAPTVPLDVAPEDEEEFWPRHIEDWDLNPEMVTLTDELYQIMEKAVDSLPDTLRSAFILRDLEGLSTKEAAKILDISPNNLKVRLHRARGILRENLATYCAESLGDCFN